MRKLVFCVILFLSLGACKSKKVDKPKQTVDTRTSKKTDYKTNLRDDLVAFALTFDGVRYKYGGTTKKGMDCSGLVHTSFKKIDIKLPRTTKDLAQTGHWIDLKEVKPGDLLFFATRNNSRKVNHVGIVTESRFGNVEFIHASTSKGVIVSNLAERYWYFSFVQARRIL